MMEPMIIEIITRVGASKIKVEITCRNKEEFDDLAGHISQLLADWHEKHYSVPHRWPDLSMPFHFGVETTEGTAPHDSSEPRTTA